MAEDRSPHLALGGRVAHPAREVAERLEQLLTAPSAPVLDSLAPPAPLRLAQRLGHAVARDGGAQPRLREAEPLRRVGERSRRGERAGEPHGVRHPAVAAPLETVSRKPLAHALAAHPHRARDVRL